MKAWRLTLGLMALLAWTGCGIYSFGGGKLDSSLKTVTIETFDNKAPIVVPTLAQDFSERLKDKFISQSKLRLATYDGDLQFSGAIVTYNVAPVAIQQGDQAAATRLTIGVQVKYECIPLPEKSWEKTFSQFSDFSTNQNLNDVEADLITDIIDRLATDIFNKTLGDW